ncbi:MAG: EAL domain-containing protein [Wenzhouxiangellaceae bacterium]|nr:EAL domain-containing protein [Wenzhouxiangellaceae bacterium]
MLQSARQFPAQTDAFSDCTEVVDTEFSFAFQPIVSMTDLEVSGHEALVRGLCGQTAASIINAIHPENRFFFDQACRMRALEVYARLGIDGAVHLNCSHVRPENLMLAINTTRECAEELGVDPRQVVLEFDNLEQLGNPKQLHNAHVQARAAGFHVLADNFGASEVGLKRLVVFQPEFAKLDRSLVRQIETSPRRQAIVHGIKATCQALGVTLIASGVERIEERNWLFELGIEFAQGFLFARPAFEKAPQVSPSLVAA